MKILLGIIVALSVTLLLLLSTLTDLTEELGKVQEANKQLVAINKDNKVELDGMVRDRDITNGIHSTQVDVLHTLANAYKNDLSSLSSLYNRTKAKFTGCLKWKKGKKMSDAELVLGIYLDGEIPKEVSDLIGRPRGAP